MSFSSGPRSPAASKDEKFAHGTAPDGPEAVSAFAGIRSHSSASAIGLVATVVVRGSTEVVVVGSTLVGGVMTTNEEAVAMSDDVAGVEPALVSVGAQAPNPLVTTARATAGMRRLMHKCVRGAERFRKRVRQSRSRSEVEGVVGHGVSEEVALGVVAAEAGEAVCLFVGLDPFGRHAHRQVRSQSGDERDSPMAVPMVAVTDWVPDPTWMPRRSAARTAAVIESSRAHSVAPPTMASANDRGPMRATSSQSAATFSIRAAAP